jgi:hypothetical protein
LIKFKKKEESKNTYKAPIPRVKRTTPSYGTEQSINVIPIVKNMGMNSPRLLKIFLVFVAVNMFNVISLSAIMLAA